MQSGQIEQVTGNGTWESKYGIMYKFEYVINGVTYQANHKGPEFAKNRGDQVVFNITRQADGYPSTIKFENPEFNGQQQQQQAPAKQAKKQVSNNRSFALSYAKDLTVSGKVKVPDMFPLADQMLRWLEGEEAINPPSIEQQVKREPDWKVGGKEVFTDGDPSPEEGDLPFMISIPLLLASFAWILA